MAHLVSIDNGGTFTDVCVIGNSEVIHAKSLTTPYDLTKCFFDVLTEASRKLYGSADLTRLLHETEYIRYSTTAGTNAMVERIGPRLGLIVRKGWSADSLQSSPTERDVFNTFVEDRIAEVDASDDASLDRTVIDAVNALVAEGTAYLVVSLDGPGGPADEIRVKRAILRRFPRHLLGVIPVLYSYELVEDGDDRRRTWSALVNAFLHPTMESFLYNSENQLRKERIRRPLLVFGNDGSSTRVAKTTAIKTHGSGPRGGLQGAAALAAEYDLSRVVTLDVGGTTTDVALIEDGRIPEKDPGETAGVPVSFRIGDVESSGVGGSSVFSVVDGSIRVGPKSVGAVPGPACFGRGGTDPTITDAYLLMGILDASSYFGGTLSLDAQRAATAITEKIADPLGLKLEDALVAMEEAYNSRIAAAVTRHTEEGDGTTLLAFGGAGPMNACGIAEAAGIKEVLVPQLAAVLSAFGISFSDISHSYRVALSKATANVVNDKLTVLRHRAERDMYAEGFEFADCRLEAWLRSDEKTAAIPVPEGGMDSKASAGDARWLDLTVTKPIRHFEFSAKDGVVGNGAPAPSGHRSVLVAGAKVEVPVLRLSDLKPGAKGDGPVLIEDDYFTCRVQDGWGFAVTANQDIWVRQA